MEILCNLVLNTEENKKLSSTYSLSPGMTIANLAHLVPNAHLIPVREVLTPPTIEPVKGDI